MEIFILHAVFGFGVAIVPLILLFALHFRFAKNNIKDFMLNVVVPMIGGGILIHLAFAYLLQSPESSWANGITWILAILIHIKLHLKKKREAKK